MLTVIYHPISLTTHNSLNRNLSTFLYHPDLTFDLQLIFKTLLLRTSHKRVLFKNMHMHQLFK